MAGTTQGVYIRYIITWDERLNFVIYLRREGMNHVEVHMQPFQWYAVRDLIRRRFIDAGKLKSGSWE